MFKHIAKAAQALNRLYGAPGAGVSVMSAPDSVLDFYRMRNVRLVDPDAESRREPLARRPVWVWGGGTAVHQTRLTLRPSGRHSTCSEC